MLTQLIQSNACAFSFKHRNVNATRRSAYPPCRKQIHVSYQCETDCSVHELFPVINTDRSTLSPKIAFKQVVVEFFVKCTQGCP